MMPPARVFLTTDYTDELRIPLIAISAFIRP